MRHQSINTNTSDSINIHIKHIPDESWLTFRVRITVPFTQTKRKVNSRATIISLWPYSVLCWTFSTVVYPICSRSKASGHSFSASPVDFKVGGQKLSERISGKRKSGWRKVDCSNETYLWKQTNEPSHCESLSQSPWHLGKGFGGEPVPLKVTSSWSDTIVGGRVGALEGKGVGRGVGAEDVGCGVGGGVELT